MWSLQDDRSIQGAQPEIQRILRRSERRNTADGFSPSDAAQKPSDPRIP